MKLRQTAAMALIASAAGLVTAAAYAQPTNTSETPKPDNAGSRFRSLDRNSDGHLTKAETGRIRDFAKAFDEADENRDGKLTPDEFAKADSIHARQQLGAYVEDSAVTAKVKAALARDFEEQSMAVSVETYRGRVLLSGWVESDAFRKKATQSASRVSGVKEVKDGMAVR